MSDSIDHLIRVSALRAADAVALRDRHGAPMRYDALDAAVSRFAAALPALGIERGARVAVWLPKQVETVVALFGAARAGCVFVPVNPALKPAQVRHILADAECALLVSAGARLDALGPEPLPDSLRHICMLDEAPGVGATAHDSRWIAWSDLPHRPCAPPPVGADDLAALLYTSGSTGRPKGVMLSHRNLRLGADSVVAYLRNDPSDRILAALPLSFDYGLNQLTTAFQVGASATLIDYLTPADLVRAIERDGITGLGGVPPLWSQLARARWSEGARRSLRYITNSGGRMPQALLAGLRELLPETRIVLMYGLTEAFRSTWLDPALLDERPGSIGKPIPHAEVAVVRPDGSATAPGEPGEIVHWGPLVAQGYWRDPERTAARFRPAPAAAGPAAAGALAVWSGDTGARDADGFFYFLARADEMIKTSGYRVSPTEVEEAAYASGLVADAVALGVPHDALGEAIALVVAAPDGQAPDESTLRACLQRALPGYMQPQRLLWRADLPRNPNGKLDRPAIVAWARESAKADAA